MKTKYSKYILIFFTIFFSFTSCVKDDLDTWVGIQVDKAEVAANEMVNFTISGNAETYVIYSGDSGHDFTQSYLVITQGKKVDQEEYVLSQAQLDIWTPILTAEISAFNVLNPTATLDANTILAGLTSLVNKPYYKDTATNRLREIMPTLKTYSQCGGLVTTYFTNNSVVLAPVGGFSTGVALNRNNLTYSYKFSTPGTYTVTVLGTKLGQKNYTGSGYIDDRTSSASEFDYKRNTATVTIVVK
jgi:hypothetical protein